MLQSVQTTPMETPRCPRCGATAAEIAPGQPLCDVCWETVPSRVRRAVARLKLSRQRQFALGTLDVPPAARKKRPRRGGPTPPSS